MAVGKMHIGGVESLELAGLSVVDLGADEGVGNVLAVGADILNRGGAGEAGDFAEGFDTGETLIYGVFYDGVPVGATHGGNDSVCVSDAGDGIPDDDTVKTLVVANSVGATAENEERKIFFVSKSKSRDNVVSGFNIYDIASGAAETHGSKFRNGDVFANNHRYMIAQDEIFYHSAR